MIKLNLNLNFNKGFDEQTIEHVEKNYDGDISTWKKDVFLTQITKALNSVMYKQTQNGQLESIMTLADTKKWGRIQKEIINSEGFTIEIGQDEIDFLYDLLSKATFDPNVSLLILLMDEAISDAKRDGENKNNLSNDPIKLKDVKTTKKNKKQEVKEQGAKK